MEEQVGALWHRLITRLADETHPEAAVELKSLQRPLGIYFRALGGDPALQIELADATAYARRRNWLQRIAGSAEKIELAWRDQRSLRLPPRIAWFASSALNTDLYYWLAALATGADGRQQDWLSANQQLSIQALLRFPGLLPRYHRLAEAHLAQRPDPASLKADEAAVEQAIRQALQQPGTVAQLPPSKRAPFPVPLWLHPHPPRPPGQDAPADTEPPPPSGQRRELEDMSRRQTERVDEPKGGRGLITIRMENILTIGEFLKVDRDAEDEEDLDQAEAAARDLDKISVARSKQRAAASLKFDLDLPSAAEDDLVLSEGLLLPEWDWRKQALLDNHCHIQELQADVTEVLALPEHLQAIAKRLRHQFQALAPARTWERGRPDGDEVDIDSYLRFCSDRAAGIQASADRLYRQMTSGARDLSCLLMADLSLSTDTYVNNDHRVIDVIRDSLFLFAECLTATGDPHALYGFSSRKRDPIRIHQIKDFAETNLGLVRGRIQKIKPGYYTRLGAAIRYASRQLEPRPEGRRLLLVLTDGKPNDLDQYEGRYGIEDTRQAIFEARRAGLEPFCVTIDRKANDYLPYLFGSSGFVVIRQPSELPKQLPLLYAQLTV
jgi:nitric oxide reductase NorD protein